MNQDQYLLRGCGIFNEPGVLGTVNALLLCADDFRLKNRWYNWSMVLGGIVTLSAAFYILCCLYLFIAWIINKYSINKLLKYIGVGIGGSVLHFFFSNYSTVYYRLITAKISRLITTGQSNRNNIELNLAIQQMMSQINTALFGNGYGYTGTHYGVLTLARVLCDIGIVGFVFYFTMFIFVYYLSKGRKVGTIDNSNIFFVIFLVSLYQRPYVFEFFVFFILYSASICIKENVRSS